MQLVFLNDGGHTRGGRLQSFHQLLRLIATRRAYPDYSLCLKRLTRSDCQPNTSLSTMPYMAVDALGFDQDQIEYTANISSHFVSCDGQRL
jgi:hypothetical protein